LDNVILVVVLAWLFVCTIYDLRCREVPMWVSLGPLIAAGIYSLVCGLWIPPLLTAALIVLSDFEPKAKRYAFVGVVSVFAAIFDPPLALTVFILATIWLFWEIGAMGGADAKLLMVIAMVIPQPFVFLIIALVGGIQGLFALVFRRKDVPYIVAIFAGTCLYAVNSLIFRIL
jgi:Flp pilus assembly protein protease CpaA